MPPTLMKSVSGIRGIVGESITPQLIASVGSAFAEFCGRGKIVIGRDTRPTGPAIEKGLESALVLSGCDVVNIGVVPTPTVEIMVEHLKADGGIVISASHNPVEWNAFKLIGKSGTFLTAAEIEVFFRLLDKSYVYKKWDQIGSVKYDAGADRVHIDKILPVIDVDAIRKKNFKVALDSVNGAGSGITRLLLKELGCAVVPVYCEPNGIFPRGAEPLAENLTALSEAVVRESADAGFAQDPDADRLAIVDERGRPIGEEYTLVLVTDHQLKKKTGRVVVNLSTTRAVEDVAMKYHAPFARTRVGEINVVEEMVLRGARIGGEGNGGVISPEIHLGRDSLAGIAYVLEMMALRDMTVSGLLSGLPSYTMKKGSIRIGAAGVDSAILGLGRIKKEHLTDKISDIDGLRIDFQHGSEFAGGWVHLRPSNTEPIFRIIAEGRDAGHAAAIYGHFEKALRA